MIPMKTEKTITLTLQDKEIKWLQDAAKAKIQSMALNIRHLSENEEKEKDFLLALTRL